MKNFDFIKVILSVIAMGIWVLVLQNFGAFKIESENSVQSVRVVNSVDVEGTVQVEGSVDVDNTVDVNVAEINGYSYFYDNNGNGKYHRIPVYTGN